MKRSHSTPDASSTPPPCLFISDSESDSDLFWVTDFLVGDSLIYVELDGRKILLVSDLEHGRASKDARVDEVVSMSPFEERLRADGTAVTLAHIADLFLRERLRGAPSDVEFAVPSSFSHFHAKRLIELGYRLNPREAPFYRDRVVKTPAEIEAIAASQKAAEEAMAFVVETIRQSEIRDGLLWRGETPLTADWLRREAHKLLLELDCHAVNTIIAGGDQGCDPHQRGTGPLPAHRTIIIDIFPRSLATRYWGDISRTVVRGRVSAAVRKLYADVLAAQEHAIAALRDGVCGQAVHQSVLDLFASRGQVTESRNGTKVGFIHSTGHGVGLDIHEAPRIGRTKCEIRAGHTVTIEPGLYYPGVGAVRLEDLLVVEAGGARNLTSFPKDLAV